jgi:serine/threonine-protein kinase HipA
MVDYAYVKIWGELVGVVRWIAERNLASFQYDKNFLLKKWDVSPIKMPVSNGDRVYSFPELLKAKGSADENFKGLPGLLSDSLPDKFGNKLIDQWLAHNGRPMGSMNPVEKLCFIGSRGMGALEFEPSQLKTDKNTFAIEISGLVEIAKKILSDRGKFEANLNKDEQRAMQEILKIGTSAGGARPKALVAYNKKTGEIRSGQTKAPNGFEHWLLKLDGVSGTQFGESYCWGRVEYAYYLMAKECRIDIMESELLEENDRAHFITKRFDREANETRHHIQTLSGIQHFDYSEMYAYSYEQVFQTMRQLRLKYPEAEQMFRRMVLNVLATNYDDHTKNFAFRLKKDKNWELAPAYDVCYSFDPANHWVSQQTLSVNGKRKNISQSDLMVIAKTNNIKKGESIINEINLVVKNWGDFARKAKVRDDLFKQIKSNHNTI